MEEPKVETKATRDTQVILEQEIDNSLSKLGGSG
jgi:hypothetical protein